MSVGQVQPNQGIKSTPTLHFSSSEPANGHHDKVQDKIAGIGSALNFVIPGASAWASAVNTVIAMAEKLFSMFKC